MRLYPTAYLDEYQMMLIFYMDLQEDEIPSLPAISRKLKECGVSDKHLSKFYAERSSPSNLEKRFTFLQWRSLQHMHQFYVLDETGIYERDGNRTHGWSLVGERIFYAQPIKNARKRWNVIAMVGFLEGVVNAFPLNVNVTWDVFREVFVAAFLDAIPGGSFICMDNGSFHKFKELVEICAPRNITVVMLPPYSPEYSPIEKVFGVVKADLRRFIDGSLEDPPAEIMGAFMRVQKAAVRSFYLDCWSNGL
jgi:transposase